MTKSFKNRNINEPKSEKESTGEVKESPQLYDGADRGHDWAG